MQDEYFSDEDVVEIIPEGRIGYEKALMLLRDRGILNLRDDSKDFQKWEWSLDIKFKRIFKSELSIVENSESQGLRDDIMHAWARTLAIMQVDIIHFEELVILCNMAEDMIFTGLKKALFTVSLDFLPDIEPSDLEVIQFGE